MKRIINIPMVLIILFSAIAFADESKLPVAEPNTAAEANSVAKADVVVVTVNGEGIKESDIDTVVDAKMKQMAGRIPESMVDRYRNQMRTHIIDQLIVEKLILQKQKECGVDVNQADIDAEINKQVAQQNLTVDEFKALLKAYGTSYSEHEEKMRQKLMFDKLIEIEITKNAQKPTAEQAKTYYDENVEQFRTPEKIHAKHILIRPDKSGDPNQAKARARDYIQELLDRIKKGEDFDELAKQYSKCPSGRKGGDLGMQPKGTFVPPFEKAAYALKPGQVSDIVETNFGYHIIKLVEHVKPETTSFDKAKDEILEMLSNKQKEELFMEYVNKIKADADIKYADEADRLAVKPAALPKEAQDPSKDEKKKDSEGKKRKKD
ncbi:MAG: peptidylprolyl isomerase [Sedimentisphaerales bacterium]|nr:peptidylprolyl isomerase [Sedimentisphaerales bacterium]